MESVELKISKIDWLIIATIGSLFGFFISLFIYFLNPNLREISTIIFSIFSAISISIFSFLFITVSNNFILPKLNKRFWYLISFIFSFCSGFFGFLFSYFFMGNFDFPILNIVDFYWFEIAICIGFFTFLVGLILHQFISMKYKNEMFKTEILDTKLKALENELNPHFLFNALNSMSELVHTNQEKAELSILNLAKFLRNAINSDSLVLIDSEIDMVKTYVEIENIRFENNILLKIIDERDYKNKEFVQKIPKFSIQLLVENGIKHGFGGDKLRIEIKINNNFIEVLNDGKVPSEIVYGTGLANLSKRLQLLKIGILESKISKNLVIFTIKIGNK